MKSIITNLNSKTFNFKQTKFYYLKLITIVQFILYIILNNFSIVYAEKFTYSEYAQNDIVTNSESIVVMDATTNVVMYSKNPETKRYPASITKIMTALLLIEYVESGKADYTDTIVFSEGAIYAVPYDGSNIGQQPNTSLTVNEALYALMLPSANEIANGIGEFVGGSMDDFAVLMTERAKELGCTGTNFANANGLHDDNHYTTALDMALIMDKAAEYDKFREVAGTYNYNFTRTNADGTNVDISLFNSNKLINESSEFYNPYVVAGKTGYTTPAEHTLVTYNEVNGHKIIISCMHGLKNEPYRDTNALLDYFKNKYHTITVSELPLYATIPIYDEATDEAFTELTIKTSPVQVTVPSSVSDYDFTYIENTGDKFYAPIAKYQPLNKATFKLNDSFEVTSDYVAVNEVKKQTKSLFGIIFNSTKYLLLGVLYFLILCLLIILPIRYLNAKKQKRLEDEKRLKESYQNDPRARKRAEQNKKSNNKNPKKNKSKKSNTKNELYHKKQKNEGVVRHSDYYDTKYSKQTQTQKIPKQKNHRDFIDRDFIDTDFNNLDS